MVVCVPLTVKLPVIVASPAILIVAPVISSELSVPVTVKSLPIVTSFGKPIVTLTSFPTLVTAVSISFVVPINCKSSADKSTF